MMTLKNTVDILACSIDTAVPGSLTKFHVCCVASGQLRHGAARQGSLRLPAARGADHRHREGGVGLPQARGQGDHQGVCSQSLILDIIVSL